MNTPVNSRTESQNGVITTIDWKDYTPPFANGKVIYFPNDNYVVTENFDKDKRDGHVTFKNIITGELVHTKKPETDADYEPLNEVCTYGVSALVGASQAPVTAAVIVDNSGTTNLCTASYALFPTTLDTFQQNHPVTYVNFDRGALCKINVVSGWVNNLDGHIRHLAIGSVNSSSQYFVYAFDSSHTGYGPNGRSNVSSITQAFWMQNDIHFTLTEYLKVIDIIEKIPDRKIRSVCRRWGMKIDKALHSYWKYTRMSEQLASLFVERKYMLRPAVMKMF